MVEFPLRSDYNNPAGATTLGHAQSRPAIILPWSSIMPSAWTRRDVLKSSAALLAAGVWSETGPRRAAGFWANDKLNLASIGLGGMGGQNLAQLGSQNMVALCDVDDQRAGKAYEEHPGAKKFYDYRQMFDKMEKEIDAVVVSTPDHNHYHPAYWTLERKKHLYLEKPMCHSVWETRKITEMARAQGVATQLGVQRHVQKPLRTGVEIARSGVLGQIKEVYSWIDTERGMPKLPVETPAVPSHIKWDLWLGPAKPRSYSPAYAPYQWRFWWDFGTGETGNWGCHILDIPFWALRLRHPTRVDVEAIGEWDEQRTPTDMAVRYKFPAEEGHDPLTLHFHQRVPQIVIDKKLDYKNTNTLFVGTEGELLCGFGPWKLYPEEKFAGYKPPKTLPDSPGFHHEWFNACKGGEPATCNFEYSGPLAETVLLANVAFRAPSGFDWDAANLRISNNDAAQQYLKSYFSKGWDVG